MAKQSARRPAPVRRSPRAARPLPSRAALVGRPLTVPFAAAFGGLVAVEMLYLAFLLRPGGGSDATPGWPAAVLLALAGWAGAGAVLVLLGRGRGWLVLAAGSVLPLLTLLLVAVLFGSLGDGPGTWWAVLLTVGPVGALVLTCRRPVREWTSR